MCKTYVKVLEWKYFSLTMESYRKLWCWLYLKLTWKSAKYFKNAKMGLWEGKCHEIKPGEK